jgi:CHASE3 domain sensor protein
MARQSLESAKMVLNALMLEQTRDRDALQRLLNHCGKMVETLQNMREQEEVRIDAEAAERKAAARKMFGELIAVEQDRKERLAQHISDLSGEGALEEEGAANGHNSKKARPEELAGRSE